MRKNYVNKLAASTRGIFKKYIFDFIYVDVVVGTCVKVYIQEGDPLRRVNKTSILKESEIAKKSGWNGEMEKGEEGFQSGRMVLPQTK